MKRIIGVLIISIISINTSFGQNRFFYISKKEAGVCFGNSAQFNGLRLNLFDKYVKKINGVNLAIISSSKELNGISIGVITDGVSLSNGISVGGIALGGEKRNGVLIGGLMLYGSKINGLGISGSIDGDTLNGFFIGGIGVAGRTPKVPIKIITGFATGTIAVGAEKISGLMISLVYVYSKEQYGVSIAGHNKTENLHGFQFGLLNYAGNNRKLFRWMPLMNFNLRKHERN